MQACNPHSSILNCKVAIDTRKPPSSLSEGRHGEEIVKKKNKLEKHLSVSATIIVFVISVITINFIIIIIFIVNNGYDGGGDDNDDDDDDDTTNSIMIKPAGGGCLCAEEHVCLQDNVPVALG